VPASRAGCSQRTAQIGFVRTHSRGSRSRGGRAWTRHEPEIFQPRSELGAGFIHAAPRNLQLLRESGRRPRPSGAHWTASRRQASSRTPRTVQSHPDSLERSKCPRGAGHLLRDGWLSRSAQYVCLPMPRPWPKAFVEGFDAADPARVRHPFRCQRMGFRRDVGLPPVPSFGRLQLGACGARRRVGSRENPSQLHTVVREIPLEARSVRSMRAFRSAGSVPRQAVQS